CEGADRQQLQPAERGPEIRPEAAAEPLYRAAFSFRLHDRHVRAEAQRICWRRADPLVERLSAYQRRLALLVADHSVFAVRRLGRGARDDPALQCRAALWIWPSMIVVLA